MLHNSWTNFGHSNNVIVSSLARGSLPFFFFALFANGILGVAYSVVVRFRLTIRPYDRGNATPTLPK